MPETEAAADDDRPPGGWGIQLVRRYMDEIRYRREAGENVLRLTKRLGPSRPATKCFAMKQNKHTTTRTQN